MEEKKTHNQLKSSRVLLWIGRILGIIPIMLFSFIFLPGLFGTYPERHANSGFYELLPMVIFFGVGSVGYILSWWKKKGWDKPGAWIMICIAILMGLDIPIAKLILEGELRAFDMALIFLLLWGIPGTLIFIATRLSAKPLQSK